MRDADLGLELRDTDRDLDLEAARCFSSRTIFATVARTAEGEAPVRRRFDGVPRGADLLPALGDFLPLDPLDDLGGMIVLLWGWLFVLPYFFVHGRMTVHVSPKFMAVCDNAHGTT